MPTAIFELAIANRFYLITKSAGFDYRHVAEAMKHNYPRASAIPSPRLAAGRCLFKDTVQLAAFAQNQFSLGIGAVRGNQGLVINIVDGLDAVHGRPARRGVRGNIDHTHALPSNRFKKALANHATVVLTTDPFVATDPESHQARGGDRTERSAYPLCAVLGRREIHFCSKPATDVWAPQARERNRVSKGRGRSRIRI
jgi:UDP-N-acetyl-D-mannosaminuronic acid dehydrogenase